MGDIKKILREPLVHFLALGAVLFLLFNLINGPIDSTDTLTIVVTQEKIDQLSDTFYDTWLRASTQEQLDTLVDEYIQNEVYYREGLALGLDTGDPSINNRIRQKMEYIIEGTLDIPTPTEEELNAFLEENSDRYLEESVISFNQVYLINSESEDVLLELELGKDPEILGDSFLLPYLFRDVYQSEMEKQFGYEFAEYVFEMEIGKWEPVRSGLANHLVYVEEVKKGRGLTLDEARSAVERDWNSEQKERLIEENYNDLLKKYKVVR